MELYEAKNPYDVFFKVHQLDESAIPEKVMLDMMDLWESELWMWHSDVKCSSHEVNDVACYAECGTSIKVFDTLEEIDTSKPIASVWANVSKRFYDDPQAWSIRDNDKLTSKLKNKVALSKIGHWGIKTDDSWLYCTHPIGYSPHNSEWFLVSYY